MAAFTKLLHVDPFYLKNILEFYHLNTPRLPQDTHHLSLITTYYPGLHRLKWILREGFNILSSDPSTQDLLTKVPSVTLKKKPKPPPTHCGHQSPLPQTCHHH